MEHLQGQDRRKNQRRTENRRKKTKKPLFTKQQEKRVSDRRSSDRRKSQRRDFYRVTYPPEARPRILNFDANVVNISSQGIMIVCPKDSSHTANLSQAKKPVNLTIQFHDSQTLDVQLETLRPQQRDDSNRVYFMGQLAYKIPITRINKEQTYLKNHFPEIYQSS